MRQWKEQLYKLVVSIHVFVNKGRVKAAGSLLYVTGAVVVTLARNQLQLIGRMLLQSPAVSQLKMLAAAGLTNLGMIWQHAETMFR